MDFLEDANDLMLKPRLLRSLLRDRLPDESQPLRSPSHLSSLLSLVRLHGLLSESIPPQAANPSKVAAAWSAAVDAWVERCVALASSKMPDKRWAGVCLLGLTCEVSGSDRFLRSYSAWFQALLSNIQQPVDSRLVKMASCASMSDLFTRLSGFPNVKKDATSLASKLTQPVLQLLNDDDAADSIVVGALDLLGTLLNNFPFSVHRHYEKVEAVIVLKMFSNKCGADKSEKLAHCLALLPKVRGDDDSWTMMMQKVLISINMHLTDAFKGLEEERRSTEIMRLLVPPGKDDPPPLGGQSLSLLVPEQATKRIQEVLLPRVYTLVQCCCTMITNPYPSQVTLPVRPLISLVDRVLAVDGSLHETLSTFTSETHQEIICSELPALHLNFLDLLTAVIKALRSQLLPYAANVTRILIEYFKRVMFPCVRIKVYSILQILLISMGIGMAIYLAEDVISNAYADLNPFSSESMLGSSNVDHSKVAGESTVHHGNRKRKHVSGTLKELPNGLDLGKETVNRKLTATLSVQIAALGTLEALVTVAGSLRAESWRPDVDKLLLTVASSACSVGWFNEKKTNMMNLESSGTQASFQIAALQALLASLLSHANARPPYLSQGFEIFRRGKQEIGSKVAAFCTHAILALEVLIHPRSLPLTDIPVTMSSGLNEVSDHHPYGMFGGGSQKPNLFRFSTENHRAAKDFGLDDSDLYNSWLDEGEENADGVTNREGHMEDADKPGAPVEMPNPEKVTGSADMDITSSHEDCGRDGVVRLGNNEEPVSEDAIDVATGSVKLPRHQGASFDISHSKAIAPGIDVEPAADKGDLHRDVNPPMGSSIPSKEGKIMSYDSDSPSLDSLPDIVDADPDSD